MATPPPLVFVVPRSVATASPVSGLRSSVKCTGWPISQDLLRDDRMTPGLNQFDLDLLLTSTNRLPMYLSDVVTRGLTKISCLRVAVFPERSVTVHVTRFLPIGRTAGALLVIVSHDGSSKASVAVTPAISGVKP